MKDPLKLAAKEMKRCGAQLVHENRAGQTWRLPWGERWHVSNRTPLKAVREKLAAVQERADPLSEFMPALAPPAGEKLVGSDHFAERFVLMSNQAAALTHEEVRAALYEPTETRYCERTGSYAYIRERVAVIAAPCEDGIRLITPLWTRRDLWRDNPRYQREESHA